MHRPPACSLPRYECRYWVIALAGVLEDDARHAACCAATCFAPLEWVLHNRPFYSDCTPTGTPSVLREGLVQSLTSL